MRVLLPEKHHFEVNCKYGKYINREDNYLISDSDKGFIEAKEKFFPKRNYFTRFIHKESNITKNGALRKCN